MALNEDIIDKWTAVHALAGLGAGFSGASAPVALGAAALYEVVEYAHEWPRGSALFGSKRPETAANVVSDLVVYGFGYWLTSRNAPNLAGTIATLGVAALLAYTFMPRGV